ncbi:hypothetical protein NDU88_001443 [Pleurodeles waltl]|uniref:Uncharacterized protein n=1 Tax=Pleurodeles waltl TaxID=8319 RepID=A0AAV7L0R6_PLEWA|nr:hypothetical protein NDU88_001443 [Pleurodeles waltl]
MAATAVDALVRVYSGALVTASAPSRSLRLTQCVTLSLPSQPFHVFSNVCSAPGVTASRSQLSQWYRYCYPFVSSFTAVYPLLVHI